MHPEYRFQMWDWVGGRYSMWSSIGVALAIGVGRVNFIAFLQAAGTRWMSISFARLWRHNLPTLMGLLGVWNINFRKLPTLAVLPLRRPAPRPLSGVPAAAGNGEQREAQLRTGGPASRMWRPRR